MSGTVSLVGVESSEQHESGPLKMLFKSANLEREPGTSVRAWTDYVEDESVILTVGDSSYRIVDVILTMEGPAIDKVVGITFETETMVTELVDSIEEPHNLGEHQAPADLRSIDEVARLVRILEDTTEDEWVRQMCATTLGLLGILRAETLGEETDDDIVEFAAFALPRLALAFARWGGAGAAVAIAIERMGSA